MKKRDTAIDFVKFVALFLVLNSHMAISYVGGAKSLATGGAIGDALFFFASGFTLFLGKDLNFANWFKRRINRIYPSLIAVATIGAAVFSINDSFVDVFLAKKYWFIQCIFVLYPLLFLAKKYVSNHVLLLGILTPVIMAIYPFISNGSFFYGRGYYRWAVYLLFILLGAIMGKKRETIKQMNVWLAMLLTVVCMVVWYCMAYLLTTSWMLIVSVFPLMGVAVFMYYIGKSKPFEKLFHTKVGGPILVTMGALCLESYLIQKMIITDRWNGIFPLNIPLIMVCVLLASYCAKLLSNLITQIFDSQPLDWKKIFKIY